MSNQQRQFININSPDDVRSRRYVWNVRSHASRSSRSPARISRAENQERRNRAAQAQRHASTGGDSEGSTGTGDYADSFAATASTAAAVGSPAQGHRSAPRRTASAQSPQLMASPATSPTRPSLPPGLMELIHSLSEASPYLYEPGAQQQQNPQHPWPGFVDEPALYLAQLLSAIELVNRIYPQPLVNHVDNLSLRVSALRSIWKVLGDSELAHKDAILASVVQMTLHESKFGDLETYSMHMQGLRYMIELRGGMDNVRDPFLHQAVRFALALEVHRSQDGTGLMEQQGMVQEHQLVISIHSALLTFIGQPRGLSQRLYWLLYHTSRQAARLSGLADPYDVPAESEPDPTSILRELLDFGSPMSPGGQGSAMETQQQTQQQQHRQQATPEIYSIVGECTRLAMVATLYHFVANKSPEAGPRTRAQALATVLGRLPSEKLLDTQFAFVFAWAHYAVNGARQPDFSIDPWTES